MTRRPLRNVLLLSAVAAASAPASATPVVRHGTFKVTGSVTLGPNVPISAALAGTATARLYGNDSGKTFEGAAVSAEMTRSGSKAVITLIVRYVWTLDSASLSKALVFIDFRVAAANAINSSATNEVEVALPADGDVTPVAIAASL